ncbi:MAG TPA: ribonuclease HII [Bacteroidia bacterium]|nr:ribonuclease HII [Bacteroidia bacterium]
MLKLSYSISVTEAGCDEAGRGCLAGPVFAAAVILPEKFRHRLLNDSKQMTHDERMEVRPYIEKHALAFAVGICTVEEIDTINILRASFEAMHRAVRQLSILPQHLLIDGNRFTPYPEIPHTCIIEGDGKYKNIAAASVLAKTYRDDHMLKLHEQYPEYAWNRNKGYGTVAHRDALLSLGPTEHHRKSFRLLPDQLEFTFDETLSNT